MAMTDIERGTVDVVRRLQAVQYTGHNGAAIAAQLGVDITAEDDESFTYGVKQFRFGQRVPLNAWIIWQTERSSDGPVISVQGVLDEDEFAALYRILG